jgi:hypothetical protein
MNIAQQVERILAAQGQQMTLHFQDGGTGVGLGSLQPFLSQSRDDLWQQASKLGSFDGARFRLYGSVEADWAPEQLSWVEFGGNAYSIRSVQPLYWGAEKAYWWAIATPRDEEEDCP